MSPHGGSDVSAPGPWRAMGLGMNDSEDVSPPSRSATQVLADLVARKSAAGRSAAQARGDGRQSERAAAARSASKSKPAMKKS